jgi:hypothetical protein
MKDKKSFEISAELMDGIISTAYGDAGFFEKIKIHKLAKEQPEVRELLDEYRGTANSVHSIKPDECPDTVIYNNKPVSKIENKSSGFLFDIYTALFARPVISAAVIVILSAAVIVSVSIDNGSYNGYTRAEIEMANLQTKQALALVSSIFSKTENSLKNDIIKDKVSKPINNGMTMVNNLFIDKEKKNEN